MPPMPPMPPPTKIKIFFSNPGNYINEYVLPPMPAAASFSGLGASTTTASAVVNNDATPLASCNADRTTYNIKVFISNKRKVC